MTPSRVRGSVVADKLQLVERMLAGVETLPLASETEFLADPRMVAAGESFLRRALEALFDLGRHVLAKPFAEPTTEYKEIADRLERHAVVDRAVGAKLRRMAGYRNRLAHFYEEVTPTELYQILTVDLEDIRKAIAALRAWLASHPDLVDGAR